MTAYFWKDGALVVHTQAYTEDARKNGFEGCLCADTNHKEASMRYGHFVEAEVAGGRMEIGWEHVPFETFPAEFKTHLLLLGVA